MTFDTRRLLELLPAIYRLRDIERASHAPGVLSAAEAAELADLEADPGPLSPPQRRRLELLRLRRECGPLGALLWVLADEIAVLEENVAQLDDDLFVETAAPWVLPYIGDLIGYRPLHGKVTRVARRAEVAHTIAFRRRKGTASMLEQLARDVTDWNARAVEFFSLLATTQSMNHKRLANRAAPSMRDGDGLELIGSAFDAMPRSLDVRRIATGAGRYNVPNIGIFLWPIDAQRLRSSPATPDQSDPRRFRFSPLGNDTALYTRPQREDDISHLAEPINVPAPITRRRLFRHLDQYYGVDRSFAVAFDNVVQPLDRIDVCDLSGWKRDASPSRIAVDPVLGRLIVGAGLTLPGTVGVTFHYGGPSEMGAGEYERRATFALRDPIIRVPVDQPTIQAALQQLRGSGVVEIVDSGRYTDADPPGAIEIDVTANTMVELRAAEGRRPTLALTKPLTLRGGIASRVNLNGLLITGAAIDVPQAANGLRQVVVRHCTLVPGRSLNANGSPTAPGEPSVRVAIDDCALALDHSITGALRVRAGSRATLVDSIVDAGSETSLAYAAEGGSLPGGPLEIESTTFVGATRTVTLSASNTIFVGRVEVTRRQEGCLRFTYASVDSIVPRRYRCQPTEGIGAANVPQFASLHYGSPRYCRLVRSTPDAIRRGSEDESEMGAFRRRYEPQRHADVLTRLDEYLRVGLEAGIFYESDARRYGQ